MNFDVDVFDSEVNGIRISIPSININTVASGGGSKLYFKNETFKVGPDSVGAFPGPTCYGNGGDLEVRSALEHDSLLTQGRFTAGFLNFITSLP